jgi:carboxyl-terminal processing protease
MRMALVRTLTAGFILAAFVACSGARQGPGPEARAAADELASQSGAPQVKNRTEFEAFARVFDQVRALYVDPVDDTALLKAAAAGMRDSFPETAKAKDSELVSAAINGMLSSLDPYSTYLDADSYEALQEQTRGQFGGIGLQVAMENNLVKVISPIDGTPAAAAGVKPGDFITHADGQSLDGLSLRDAVMKLRGLVGSQVRLTIRRGEQAPFDVAIVRDVIQIHPVRWSLENNIGYIRLSTFNARASAEFVQAIKDIRAKAGSMLAGYIIDLRNNPGGLFDQSVFISDVLLQHGDIVSTKGRVFRQSHSAAPGDVTDGLPIVVLINGGSASAAEIVAGALHDNKRAILVGDRSYGKGSVQTIIPFATRDGLKLTTARYYTPSGTSVDGGIVPDIEVANDNEREGDEQLERAEAELHRLAHR